MPVCTFSCSHPIVPVVDDRASMPLLSSSICKQASLTHPFTCHKEILLASSYARGIKEVYNTSVRHHSSLLTPEAMLAICKWENGGKQNVYRISSGGRSWNAEMCEELGISATQAKAKVIGRFAEEKTLGQRLGELSRLTDLILNGDKE